MARSIVGDFSLASWLDVPNKNLCCSSCRAMRCAAISGFKRGGCTKGAFLGALLDFVALLAPAVFARLPGCLGLGFCCATSVDKVDLLLDALPFVPTTTTLDVISLTGTDCSLSARKRSIAYPVTVFGLVLLFET